MGFETYNWEDLKVGEVIKVVNGEEVPADVLLVSADS
jgi:magnesium-transporting ATPase (P-type)